MSYPDTRMISWRRYGYRMIGAADRAMLARARYMGQSLDLSSSIYHRAGTSTTTGESTTYTTPPPPPAPHVIRLSLGPPHTAPAPAPVLPPPPPPVTMTTPVRAIAQANPVCPPCDPCPAPPSQAMAWGGGALLGALIMYGVGLATREMKKKRR